MKKDLQNGWLVSRVLVAIQASSTFMVPEILTFSASNLYLSVLFTPKTAAKRTTAPHVLTT